MKYILEQNCDNFELMGKKATTLIQLERIIDNIPKWFIVSYEGFDIQNKKIKPEAEDEIKQNLKGFSDNAYFVIRTSYKTNEEYGKSFLAIKKEDILDKVNEMYLTAFSEEAENYRKENKVKDIIIPSIIIQKMIVSDKSGYAYGANPITSNVKEIMILAQYGLLNNTQGIEEKADKYIVNGENITKDIARKNTEYKIEKNEIVEKELEKKVRKKQVLPKDNILQVKEIVEKASEFFGRFQQIEWAYEGEKLYIINSKPITTLISPQNKEIKAEVKENSSILKYYEGITTPLTFSFIRSVYENMYLQLCKIFDVEKEKIEMNTQMFKNILALIDGRVYYNVNGWHEILKIFPELGKNKIHMEPIIGVDENSRENLLPVVQESNFKEKFEIIKNKYNVFSKTRKVKKITDKFNSRINDVLSKRNIKNMNLQELHDYYFEIEQRILARWDAPILNEFLSTIFQKQLKKQCIKYFKDEGSKIQKDLLCQEIGIINCDIARRIKKMAEIARCDKSLMRLLEKDDILYIKKNLIQYSDFYDAISEYLELYSDRCIHELKLETKDLKENPLPLYHAIASLARKMKDYDVEYIDYEYINNQAEEKVKNIFKYNVIAKAKFDYNLKYAKYTVENREKLRYERTKTFGRIRILFLRIGLILTSMNVIEEKRDIFYLEVDEIFNYILGKSTNNNLKDLINIRKKQYSKYKKDMQEENKIEKNKSSAISKNELNGIGVSEGITKGKAKVITNMDNIKINSEEILVADYSDPGWVLLFPKVSAILLENEKIQSDAVITAKELGTPIIVGVKDLLDSVKDGDRIELDGKTGCIKILTK